MTGISYIGCAWDRSGWGGEERGRESIAKYVDYMSKQNIIEISLTK